jgi:hypothetical protein
MIAEVGTILLADFFSRGFSAVLRVTRVIVNAHFADMQFRATSLADIEPQKGQRQSSKRCPTFPANQAVRHSRNFTPKIAQSASSLRTSPREPTVIMLCAALII